MTDSHEPAEDQALTYTVPASGEPAVARLEIKRSEFIGMVARVESEAEAREFIESVRKRFHDARHVCSAFVIGPDRRIQRSSDDGEPAGTAGVPILQAILNHRVGEGGHLSDLCVAVVRYFGGIKLGAGGLVRAYTDAAVRAIEATSLCARHRLRLGSIRVPHADAGRLENDLRASGTSVLGTDYAAEHAILRIGVLDEPERRDAAEAEIAAMSAGSLEVEWSDTQWVTGRQ